MSGDADIRERFDHPEDVTPDPDATGAGSEPPPPSPPPDPDLDMALAECAEFPLNDIGNGRRFVRHFGEDYLFAPRVGWFGWDGQSWCKDLDELRVRGAGQRLSDLLLQEINFLRRSAEDQRVVDQGPEAKRRLAELEGADSREDVEAAKAEIRSLKDTLQRIGRVNRRFYKRRDRHVSHANTTGNSGRIDSALKEAGVRLAVDFADLDVRPLDVNVQNGTLRFAVDRGDPEQGDTGTGASCALRPHARSDLCSKILTVPYDPDAACPRFDAFLERVQPSAEMRAFLLRWFGLSMTGLTVQRIVFQYGVGANGKSVLVDVIASILGDYAASARIESLTGTNRRGGGDATPDLVPLMGARMVRTSEPDEGERLQEGLIKELTGGEPLMVRALRSDFVEVRPVFKLTMSGNHKPEIRGTDDGIWRRVMLVPFDVQIPEAERDPDLAEKLLAEGPGILNRLVEGLVDYLEGGLRPPDAVTEATKEYRQDSDPIASFLINACVVDGNPDVTISSKELGEAFNYYLLERGEGQWKPMTISRRLKDRSRNWRHPKTGMGFTAQKNSISGYVGIRLIDTFRRRFNDAPRDQRGMPIAVASSSPDPD